MLQQCYSKLMQLLGWGLLSFLALHEDVNGIAALKKMYG